MDLIIMIPFIIQGIAIAVDEAYFHVKRGLPLWERIGHPIDTFTVVFCFGFVIFIPYSLTMLKVYILLSILSCLTVTKDEWVHKHHCPGTENWLHALLFINHPILLTFAGLIWARAASVGPLWLKGLIARPEPLIQFLMVQAALAALFMLYQIIYWNFIWKPSKATS
ncbi:MAG: hypothetical protein K940chlam2_01348 [Chlamydiae bacterium]|nr:hypothetical protein [Chlamydiota bacterium]